MVRRAGSKEPQYIASDWKNLGYCDPPKSPNLTCSVHPIFAIYRDDGRLKFGGTAHEYELILPALQLATNYLYSANSRKFIYSLVYADRKTVPVEGFDLIEQFDEIDPSLYSSDKMDRIWDQLAAHIRFGPFDVPGGFAYCAPGADSVDLKGSGSHGRASIICFNRGLTEDMEQLRWSGRENSMKMLRIQFILASSLCHEIAHAVEAANQHPPISFVDWFIDEPEPIDDKPEPFFKDQMTAEVGFSFVNEIFGGNFDGWRPGHPEYNLEITDCK